MTSLIFSSSPTFHLASNYFTNVPVIIQIGSTPMIEMISEENVFGAKIPIFHGDGTKLAVVAGSRIHLTEEGKKAGIKLRHQPDLEVCELDGKTIYELRRNGPAAVSITAEVYTPTGKLFRASDAAVGFIQDSAFRAGNLMMTNSYFDGCKIGIQIEEDGSMGIGVGGGSIRIGRMSFGG